MREEGNLRVCLNMCRLFTVVFYAQRMRSVEKKRCRSVPVLSNERRVLLLDSVKQYTCMKANSLFIGCVQTVSIGELYPVYDVRFPVVLGKNKCSGVR